jgi:tetratricopeptide (TPR) repeat protein
MEFLAASSTRNSNNTAQHESLMETSNCSPLNSPIEAPKRRDFDHWSSVDVPGSPLLSRLFEALKIESESTIPPLDLTSPSAATTLLPNPDTESDVEKNIYANTGEWIDFSTGAGSGDLVAYSQEVFQRSDAFSADSNLGLAELSFSEWSFREWDFSRGRPLKLNISYGLSPFPVSLETSRHGASDYGTTSQYARLKSLQDKAIQYKCQLRKFKRILGAENSTTLAAMKSLANIYRRQSKYRQAEQLYRQIAISCQRTLGLEHITTLSAYLSVVDTLRIQGEQLKARKIHERIHDTIINLVEVDNRLALLSNSIRTSLLYNSGHLGEAEKLIRQNLQIDLYTLGPRSTDTLYDMIVLAKLLRLCGKLAESEQLLRINLPLNCERHSINFLGCIESLEKVVRDQGRYDESRDLAMALAERSEILLGQEHAYTLRSLFRVALYVKRQGDLSESERQLRSILGRQIKSLGEKHPDTCNTMEGLSSILEDTGRNIEAVALLERSYKGTAEVYGASHEESLFCCRKIVDKYVELGRYGDAVALLQRTVDDAREPGEKPTVPLMWTNFLLAALLHRTGCHSKALPLYEEYYSRCFEIRGLLMTDDAKTNIIRNLGFCYEEIGRYDDAFALYQQSIDWIRSFEGDDHPAIKQISDWTTQLQEMLDASDEIADQSLEDLDSMETSDEDANERHDDLDYIEKEGVEEGLVGESNVNMDDRLAEGDDLPAEKDWMREYIDFDLLGNAPPSIGISEEDAQEDRK